MKAIEKKQLTPIRHDYGFCRLYVKDQSGKRYCILNHGRGYTSWGLPQFELHTHTRDGEPDTPINCEWVLVEGVPGTEFVIGLENIVSRETNKGE